MNMNFISGPVKDRSQSSLRSLALESAPPDDTAPASIFKQVAGALTGTGEINTSLVVRLMNWAQHLLAAALIIVAIFRQNSANLAIQAGEVEAGFVYVPLKLMLITGACLMLYQLVSIPLAKRPHPRQASTWLIGYTLLWIGALWISPEFIWFAFLLWLLAGHLLKFSWGLSISAVILLAAALAPILHHGTPSTPMIAGPTLGGVFTFTISRAYLQMLQYANEREELIKQLTATQKEINILQDDLAFAQRQAGAVEERLRISRDLHDTVAQSLSSMKLLSRAEAESTENPAVKQKFRQFEQLSAEGITDLRRIIEKLAPQELENSALPTALSSMLKRLAEDFKAQGRILDTRLDFDSSIPKLSKELEMALLRSAQSALANIRLHSQATQVVVSVIDSGDTLRMDIIDNGIGFDPFKQEHPANLKTNSTSFGLRFIRSRMQELGGGLEIESSSGNGTALSIYAPINRNL